MRTKPYIRFNKSGKVDNITQTNIFIKLTGLGKTAEGKSYQINQSAVTPIQTYVLYWKDKDECNAVVELTQKKGRPALGTTIIEQNNELNKELLAINERVADLCNFIKLCFTNTPNNQFPKDG